MYFFLKLFWIVFLKFLEAIAKKWYKLKIITKRWMHKTLLHNLMHKLVVLPWHCNYFVLMPLFCNSPKFLLSFAAIASFLTYSWYVPHWFSCSWTYSKIKQNAQNGHYARVVHKSNINIIYGVSHGVRKEVHSWSKTQMSKTNLFHSKQHE